MADKILYIVTGPPGSGKTTYANQFPELQVYDHDLGNKLGWHSATTDAILCTSAPNQKTKEYWASEARKRGFTPKIVVMWCTRMEAMQRMMSRSGQAATERNDLQANVHRWFDLYSAHPLEKKVSL